MTQHNPAAPNPVTPAETQTLTVMVKILAQMDICHATYELTHLADNEPDPEKNAALRRVADALWDITNWSGVEAIASDAIVGDTEYMKGKI